MKYCYLLLFLFLTACHSSPVKNEADSTSDEQTRKTVSSLFDTTSLAPRNTASFHTVEIKQMQFVPDTLKVHKGDTILWVNNDIVTHDITEEKNKEWTSAPLPASKSWQMVVTKSSDYFCSIHVVMKGKIVVE